MAGTRRAPHESQKILAGGFIRAHIGQRLPAGADSVVPHLLQKRLSSRLAVPQFGQLVISHSTGDRPP